MSQQRNVDIHGIEKTGRSDDGLPVLEVTLMIEASENGRRTFTGWAYDDRVELKSDPSDLNLHPDDLKDLMAGAAHLWDNQFGDWDADIKSHDEPVRE